MLELRKVYDWLAPESEWHNLPADPAAGGQVVPIRHKITGEMITRCPPVRHVQVLKLRERHLIPTKTVGRPELAGIVELAPDNSTITIKTDKGPLVLRVDSAPGRYCCHCGEKLPDDDGVVANPGVAARAHVAEHHAGAESPDPENRSGYRKQNHYDCVPVEIPAGITVDRAA